MASTTDTHPVAPPRVVILVPAHNEEQGIAATLRSLLAQTRPPDRILVAAYNCSDRTAEIARTCGAEVIETVDNRAKKAGALNQAFRGRFRRVGDRRSVDLPHGGPNRRGPQRRADPSPGPDLRAQDFLLAMDADSELDSAFVESGLAVYAKVPNLGGLSGAIVAREPQNLLEQAQAIEYAKGTRLMSRKQGRVHVLSGAATIFPAATLQRVADSRGSELPGPRGSLFLEDSLTEDYELTLAIRKLGYRTLSTKTCRVVTDLMPTLRELSLQRVRWQRGAIESLALYGWTGVTRRTWIGVAVTYLQSFVMPLMILSMLATFLVFHAAPDWRWLGLLPLFLSEQFVNARRVGGRTRLLPLLVVPLWIYENLQFAFAWKALAQLARRSDRVWIT